MTTEFRVSDSGVFLIETTVVIFPDNAFDPRSNIPRASFPQNR